MVVDQVDDQGSLTSLSGENKMAHFWGLKKAF